RCQRAKRKQSVAHHDDRRGAGHFRGQRVVAELPDPDVAPELRRKSVEKQRREHIIVPLRDDQNMAHAMAAPANTSISGSTYNTNRPSQSANVAATKAR